MPSDVVSSDIFHTLQSSQLKFIVYRFHPGAWWYGIVFLFRNLLVSLATTFDPDKPLAQTMFLGIVLLGFLSLQMMTWPWRTHALNWTWTAFKLRVW